MVSNPHPLQRAPAQAGREKTLERAITAPVVGQRAIPRIVTRPVIDSMASATRRSWRRVVRSRHGLTQAKSTIISGMGGGSLCRVRLGKLYSTQHSAALPHLHFWRRYWASTIVLSSSICAPSGIAQRLRYAEYRITGSQGQPEIQKLDHVKGIYTRA